ncbi:MAG: pentapeptide repeat-containing protein [Leptolyngbyaceae cyanobacterium]
MAQQIMDAHNLMGLVPRPRLAVLACKRLAAWSLEVGLVAMTAAVPWGLGQYALLSSKEVAPIEAGEKQASSGSGVGTGTQITLNPLVKAAQNGWARIAQVPPHRLYRTVPRTTNILWTVALIAPVVAAGSQLILLSRTGSSLPKRWLGLQVISTSGGYLKLYQIVSRELIRWGPPLVIVGGATVLSGISLGVFTPVVIALLAMAESAAASDRPWHDRIAKTRVILKPAGYLPISSEPLAYLLPITTNDGSSYDDSSSFLLNSNGGVQLYGETLDDDWWLTEAEGNLTSVVLAPRVPQASDDLVLSPSPRALSGRSWLMVVGSLLLACGAGFGIGRMGQLLASSRSLTSGWARDDVDVFLQATQSLSAKTRSGGDYSAAILMLAQVDDPRTAQYLADLLSQSSQPETLAAVQQALITQGLDGLEPLLSLSRSLESDLQQPISAQERQLRLEQRHVVQGAIAKLLTIYSDQLRGTRLDRVNLGYHHDLERSFRLIQPGLLAAGTSWQDANLDQANLAGASFFDVGIDGKLNSFDDQISDLTGISLAEASLENVNFQGAQLSNSNLRQADLTDANLIYANLEQAQLTSARLVNASAPQSHWQGSNLVGADLTQASFDKADFSQARLNRVEATHSSWQKAILPQTDWVGANLIGAEFTQARLTGANFQGANLDSVNFSRADMSQVNLRNADLRQTRFIGATLTEADFAGAILHDGTSTSDSFITPNAQLSDANRMRGVNFSRVRNLDGRQLNYICAQGGIHPSCPDVAE